MHVELPRLSAGGLGLSRVWEHQVTDDKTDHRAHTPPPLYIEGQQRRVPAGQGGKGQKRREAGVELGGGLGEVACRGLKGQSSESTSGMEWKAVRMSVSGGV